MVCSLEWYRWVVLLTIGLAVPICRSVSAESSQFELRDGDRIAFLGGTFIERMQNEGYLETALTTAFPEKNLTFRNLGWSGDTVWGDSRGVFGSRSEGFKRLVDDTLAAKPTVLVIAYGHNEAFAGQDGLAEFRDGLMTLLDALAPSKARVVLIAPPQALPVPPPLPPVDAYNRKLAAYRDAIKQVARERQVSYIDWFDLVAAVGNLGELPPVTSNGLHWTDAGEWRFAPEMAKSFGAPEERFLIDLDIKTGILSTNGYTVLETKFAPDKVSMIGLPRSLPPPLLPLNNAESNLVKLAFRGRPFARLRITGLAPGVYDVILDGQTQFAAEHGALANGLPIGNSPQSGRVIKLRQLIQEKNTLFFYRYRPQNETYLFLFRKHEQGNNAVEIPQFDPLIEAKEKEIAGLRIPRELTIEIKPKVG